MQETPAAVNAKRFIGACLRYETKERFGVASRGGGDLFFADSENVCERRGRMRDHSGFAAFSAKRNWREEGAICLDHDAISGDKGGDFSNLMCVREGEYSGERDQMAQFERCFGLRDGPSETVKNSANFRKLFQNSGDIFSAVPLVDHNRQI